MGWWLQAVVELILAAGSEWVEFRPCGFVPTDVYTEEGLPYAMTQPAPDSIATLVNPDAVSEIVKWRAGTTARGPQCTTLVMMNGMFRHVVGSYEEVREKLGK